MPSRFSVDQIPDLTGKIAIVTGANTGIGRVTAVELARKNAQVILACRSRERTEPVLQEIEKLNPKVKATFMELDLGNWASVQKFGKKFLEDFEALHLLVNNAGIMALPELQLSTDGMEQQMATNHVGHFLLTLLLLPLLEKSAPSRIVCLSSSAHQMAPTGGILFDDMNNEKKYSGWTWYGQSKLANLLFARELSKRLEKRGVRNVYVNAVHPGVVRTELGRNMHWFFQWGMKLFSLFIMSPEDGALTQLYVSTSPDIEKDDVRGRYFVPIAKEADSTAYGKDEALAEKLWTWTEERINEKLPGALPKSS